MRVREAKFRNRLSAGLLLASQIAPECRDETVIVAIPYGGIPVAAPISRQLNAPAMVCLTTRVALPDHPDLSVGTISHTGEVYLDLHMLDFLTASDEAIAGALQSCQTKIAGLSTELSRYAIDASLEGKDLLLVDDAVATGNTVLGTLQYLQTFQPSSVSVVAPVISPYAVAVLAERKIRCITMLVGGKYEFRPQGYYSDFARVDGPTCLDILGSL